MESIPRDVRPLRSAGCGCQTAGDGPAILFWPSLLMTGELWSAQVAHFAATHTVIAVDPPGHGASEPLTGPFTFDDCVGVLTAILDELGVEQA